MSLMQKILPRVAQKRMLPQRIKWQWCGHIAMADEHRMSYRSDRWGCNCVLITPKKGEMEWGRRRTEYLMDGTDRRWKSWRVFRRHLAAKHGLRP